MKILLCVALLMIVVEYSVVEGGWFDTKPSHKELRVILPLKGGKDDIQKKFEEKFEDEWQYLRDERKRGCKDDGDIKEESVMVYEFILEESSKTTDCIEKLKKFMKKYAPKKGKIYWRGAVEYVA